MEAGIRGAAFVLVICTDVYRKRVEGREESGKGKGAIWEGALITQDLYDNSGRNERFLPVVFTPDDVRFVQDFSRLARITISQQSPGTRSFTDD